MNINKQPDIKITQKKKKYFTTSKDYGMVFLGFVSILYLLNFTFGLIEFLPDALPFVGNLDEVVMTGLLLSVFKYFGIDLTQFFKRN
jgi:hypothetical protein